MASELRVNTSTNRVGLGTITYTDTGPIISGITTGNNFKTGTTNVHSTGVELVNINTAGGAATFGGDVTVNGNELFIADSIKHVGDTDTLISFPSNDTIQFNTAGTERLRIKSGGEVRIGANSTTASTAGDDLVIEGSSDRGLSIISGTSSSANIYFGDSSDADVGRIAYQHNDNALDFSVNAGSTALRITSAGTLKFTGQNTSLETAGITHHTNNNLYIRGGTSGLVLGNHDNTNTIHISNSDFIKFETTDGSERMRLTSVGRLGINETSPDSMLHVRNDNSYAAKFGGQGGGSDYYLEIGQLSTNGSPGLNATGTNAGMLFRINGNEKARITDTGNVVIGHTSTNNTFQIGNTGHNGYGLAMQAATYGAILQVGEGTTPTTAAALWTRNMNNGGTPTTLFRVNGNGVCIAGDSSTYDGGNTKPNLYVRGTGGRQMKIHNPNAGTCSLQMTNSTTGQGEDAGTQLFTQGGTGDFWIQSAYATADIAFATKPSGGSTTERFRIGSDGKLYKDGNHFYPLVNYVEVSSFTGASVSSNSYTDLRTIYSGYSPKKAGNLIVIHHQSQCWQGGQANSSGDAFWKIQRSEGGGSWTDTIENGRIMGNMDGRNYTGNSGLARHHRTVHLMGSFTCTGSSFNLKTQGKVDFTSVGLQWYHHSNNILQIWEYEKG